MACKYCCQSLVEYVICTVCSSFVCTLCARTASFEYICPACLLGTNQGVGLSISKLGEKRLPMARKETLCHLCGATIEERAHCAVLEHCKKHKVCSACYSNSQVVLLSDIPCPGAILAAAEPITSMEKAVGKKITPELITYLLGDSTADKDRELDSLDKQTTDCNMFLPYIQLKELAAICNDLDKVRGKKQSSDTKGITFQDPRSWSTSVILPNTPQNADLAWRISALQTEYERVYYHPRMASLATPDDAHVLPSNFNSDEHKQVMKSVKMGAYVKCIKLGAPPNALNTLLQPDSKTPEELADLAGIKLCNDGQLPLAPCLVALRQK